MNEQQIAQERQVQIRAERYRHRLDETVLDIERRAQDLDKEMIEYITQFIPEELR